MLLNILRKKQATNPPKLAMGKRRVVVSGVGVITPIGNDKDTFWKSLLDGKSGASRLTSFDPTEFVSQVAAEVKGFDPSPFISAKDLRRMDKFVQYAVSAARMAVDDAKLFLDREDPNRIGTIIGSGIGGLPTIEREHKVLLERGPSRLSPFLIPMLIVNMAPGQVSINLGIKGPNSCIATACASANHALGEAFHILRRGEADVMIAGGTESCITPMGFGGFCSLRALSTRNDQPERASRPFDRTRDGFVMAEGAGMVVLETLEHARKRSAFIYAEMIGCGMSADAYHMTAPDPTAGGASRAMQNALINAEIKPEDVSYINAHGTSTFLNDKIETLAIKKIFGEYAKKVAVSSTKSMTGHLLGAAGGVEFIACCFSIKENIVPPTINYEFPDPECDLDYVPNSARKMKVDVAMSNALGFGGHNATVILRRFKE